MLGRRTMQGNDIVHNVRVEPKGQDFHFYLTGEIGHPENYTDLFHVFNMASPADVVYLHLNTPGGSLDTCVNIIHGIQDTDAMVVACADGEVASAGSIIFFACHGLKVGDYSNFLVHDGSGSVGGKTNDTLSAAQNVVARLKKLYNDVYYPYLTKKEISEVLGGKDLWLTAEDVNKRIKKAMKTMEKNNNDADETIDS